MKSKSFCVFALALSVFNIAWSFESIPSKPVKVSNPVNLETCFSPDEPCSEKLLQFISSAEKSLDIAIYSISLDDLANELIKKSKTIKVRIVCDKVQAHGMKSKVKDLLENGVSIRYGKQKGLMHDKFTIVDSSMLETGSFNYTNNAANSNQENQIYLADAGVVSRFAERFEQMWEESVEIDITELKENLKTLD
jgi:phosphatidylserine/phosphatidylglycerophosphate/cardiolipin synthase-like enzyme